MDVPTLNQHGESTGAIGCVGEGPRGDQALRVAGVARSVRIVAALAASG